MPEFAAYTKCSFNSPQAKMMRMSLILLAMAAVLPPASAQTAHFGWAQNTFHDAAFSFPQGVAVDGQGNVFIADTGSPGSGNLFEVMAVNGSIPPSPTIKTVATGFNHINAVAVDGIGNVYVVDVNAGTNGVVYKYSAVDGTLPASPSRITIGSGFYEPFAVAADSNENAYVIDINSSNGHSRTREFVAADGYTTINVLDSSPAFAAGLGFDKNDNLYVTDEDDSVVDELTASSGYTTAKTLTSAISEPYGVAVDRNGNVFVTDSNDALFYEILAVGGSIPASPMVIELGSNWVTPATVAVDANDDLFVVDAGAPSLVEFASAGANFGSVNVGSASASSIPMIFIFDSGGELGSAAVLTQGATTLDFTDAGSDSCTAGTTYAANAVCTVNVTFKPGAPGLRQGAAVLYNESGKTIATGYAQGVGAGPQVAFPGAAPASVVTGVDVPLDMAVDAAGDLVIANSFGANVWFVAAGGSSHTLVGSGFSMPTGVAIDGGGNIYVADNGSAVYEVSEPSGTQKQLNIAGLFDPENLAVDGAGNLYIGEPTVRKVLKVTPAGVQTAVGTGLNSPRGLAVDGAGNLYIADYAAGTVFKVTPGGTQTSMGVFGGPTGVAVDAAGDIFVAVFGTGKLDEVALDGTQTTLLSGLDDPDDIVVDGSGNLYFTEYVAGTVERVDRADAPTVNFPTATAVNAIDATDGTKIVQVVNSGNLALNLTALGYPADFSEPAGDASACTATTSLNPAGECDVPVEFTPRTTGSLSESVTLTDNLQNVPGTQQSITVTGTGLLGQTIAFTPITGLHSVGGNVTLSATASSGLPVSFISTDSKVCTVSGTTVSLIAAGSCDIEARQWGNSTYAIAPFAFQIFWVGHTPQTISFPAIPFDQNALSTLPLSATATSGLTVTFASLTPATCTVSGTTASLNSYGFCTIQTSQSGNSIYGEAPHVDQTIFVHHLNQTIDFPPIGTQRVNAQITLSATTSSGLPVEFVGSGCSISISGNVATLSSVGTCTIEARQAGDGQYHEASAKQSFKVTAQ
jgi:sugar lactone lactonase YvrE